MKEKAMRTLNRACVGILLLILLLACITAATAADEEFGRDLPGQWILTCDVQEEGEELREADLAALTLEKDGKASIRCNGKDGKYLYTCEGTWTFEFVPDLNDKLTLLFTSTDDPARAGSEYRVECVYDAYAEAWVENDVMHTYMILTPISCSGVSPILEVSGCEDAAMHREQGPNMRIVNCRDYVSLRANRSKTSARVAKVPLGAQVLAFPEHGNGNGFIECVYHDEYGYILAEYLEPIE